MLIGRACPDWQDKANFFLIFWGFLLAFGSIGYGNHKPRAHYHAEAFDYDDNKGSLLQLRSRWLALLLGKLVYQGYPAEGLN